MTLSEKIEELNTVCLGSLSLTAGIGGWSLHSYIKGTPFYSRWLEAETFEEVIDLALSLLENGDKVQALAKTEVG